MRQARPSGRALIFGDYLSAENADAASATGRSAAPAVPLLPGPAGGAEAVTAGGCEAARSWRLRRRQARTTAPEAAGGRRGRGLCEAAGGAGRHGRHRIGDATRGCRPKPFSFGASILAASDFASTARFGFGIGLGGLRMAEASLPCRLDLRSLSSVWPRRSSSLDLARLGLLRSCRLAWPPIPGSSAPGLPRLPGWWPGLRPSRPRSVGLAAPGRLASTGFAASGGSPGRSAACVLPVSRLQPGAVHRLPAVWLPAVDV